MPTERLPSEGKVRAGSDASTGGGVPTMVAGPSESREQRMHRILPHSWYFRVQTQLPELDDGWSSSVVSATQLG